MSLHYWAREPPLNVRTQSHPALCRLKNNGFVMWFHLLRVYELLKASCPVAGTFPFRLKTHPWILRTCLFGMLHILKLLGPHEGEQMGKQSCLYSPKYKWCLNRNKVLPACSKDFDTSAYDYRGALDASAGYWSRLKAGQKAKRKRHQILQI
jgi:hypothetical protein